MTFKNFLNATGRFIYRSEENEYTATVLERKPLFYKTRSVFTCQTIETDSGAESIIHEMNGRRYHIDVALGEIPQATAGAQIWVKVKKAIGMGMTGESFSVKSGEDYEPVFMYPCIEDSSNQ